MLSQLALLFAPIAVALADGRGPLSFDDYCAAFEKSYTGEEYGERKALYEQRLTQHGRINARPGATWTAGPGPLTDLRPEEMRRFFGYRGRAAVAAEGWNDGMEAMAAKEDAAGASLPRSVDWRNHTTSIVPPVRSQGGCGSCWVFSAIATIESAVAQATGVMPRLSQQHLTSCTPNPQHCGGEGGCDGATAQLAYNYTIQKGVASYTSAPYTSGMVLQTGECASEYTPVAGITGYVQLPLNDAKSLLQAVAMVGLVTVSVDASAWFLYGHGIFDECNKVYPTPNHAAVLVGYGDERGVSYWIIQNSWGTMFGEEGYIRLRRYEVEPCGLDEDPQENSGCDGGPPAVTVCGECGVLSDSSYPTGAFLWSSSGPDRRLYDGFFV